MSTHDAENGPVERQPRVAKKSSNRVLEAPQYAAFIGRSIRALGRRAGEHDPTSLVHFGELRELLDAAEHQAVAALLEQGFTYREIARALGVSHQAVMKRFRSRAA